MVILVQVLWGGGGGGGGGQSPLYGPGMRSSLRHCQMPCCLVGPLQWGPDTSQGCVGGALPAAPGLSVSATRLGTEW